MFRIILLLLALNFLTVACGQKSTIKNDVKSQRLADAYGDGKYMVRNLTFPITDSSLAYETPLPGLGPIVGGIIKFVGDIFAKNTKMGKLQMAYTQPLPTIPDELHAVRLSRVFFYIKPEEKQRRVRDWFSRVFMGKGNVNFDFLDKFAVRMTTVQLSDPDNSVSILVTEDYNKFEMASLMDAFAKKPISTVIDTERAKELILFKYDGSDRKGHTNHDKYGQIHIIESSRPHETKHFLLDQPELKGLYKRILILENSLLVELIKDPIANEVFEKVLFEMRDQVKSLGVTYIDSCDSNSCLELNIPQVNLIPIVIKGNAIKLDALIHAGKVPESFNLKGFVEFEVEIDSPI